MKNNQTKNRLARSYPPLEALADRGIRLGLEGMERLMEELGSPHTRVPSIMVAGSNGKGSTASGIAAVLKGHGLRTGLTTSPHLVSPNERIQIDGRPLPWDEFTALFDRLAPAFEKRGTTYFEALIAMSFTAFAEKEVDVMVAEVGMGGRYDATNILRPTVCAFTDFSLEHTQHLGKTLSAIAAEKAAIMKERDVDGRSPASVVLKQDEAVLRVLQERAQSLGVPLNVLELKSGMSEERAGEPFRKRNLFLACEAARLFFELIEREFDPLKADAILRAHHWPGRYHFLRRADHPLLILDGAHNPGGAEALAVTLTGDRNSFSRPLIAVTAVLQDKDTSAMIRALAPAVEGFVFTRAATDRSRNPRELLEQAEEKHRGKIIALEDDPERALERAEELAGKRGTVLVTGSLYLVGEIFAILGIDPYEENGKNDSRT